MLAALMPQQGHHTSHDRDVGRLDAPVGQVDACWRLGCPAHPDQDNIGLVQRSKALPVIMGHGEIQRLDAGEVPGIQLMLCAWPVAFLNPQIACKARHDRIKHRHRRHRQLATSTLEHLPQFRIDDRVQDKPR
jgi:hypothetical protein